MKYEIDVKECLKCGLCVERCPAGAILSGPVVKIGPGEIHTVEWAKISPELCTGCGVCVSYEYWCPGQAIKSADNI